MLVPGKIRIVAQFLYGALYQYGWLHSLKVGKPVDRHGGALPWFSYPCIDFLKQLDYREKSVFEWGAGQSTLFWSARAKSVVSIEHDPDWCSYLRPLLSNNCDLRSSTIDNEVYVGQIRDYPEGFDIIVIDGTYTGRVPASRIARDYLKEGGFIILDNSDQCLQSAKVLRDSGLIQVDFTGFCPGNGYAQTTSIFFDRSYCFQPIGEIQPHQSPAQPNPPWPDA